MPKLQRNYKPNKSRIMNYQSMDYFENEPRGEGAVPQSFTMNSNNSLIPVRRGVSYADKGTTSEEKSKRVLQFTYDEDIDAL